MEWTLILVLIAFAIYALYNITVIGTLGLPLSLSETFYRLKAKKEWLALICPIAISLIALLALPEWISMSSHNALCILPIITTKAESASLSVFFNRFLFVKIPKNNGVFVKTKRLILYCLVYKNNIYMQQYAIKFCIIARAAKMRSRPCDVVWVLLRS